MLKEPILSLLENAGISIKPTLSTFVNKWYAILPLFLLYFLPILRLITFLVQNLDTESKSGL